MRRRSFIGSAVSAPPGAVDKTAATVGSICISNGIDIWFMPRTAWQSYSGTEYQAIGVTVAAVGDCGDTLVRVCSIPYMDCKAPDVGSISAFNMYWNGNGTTIGGGITETTSTAIAKADYNGKVNTTAILAKATGQSNWRTASTLKNGDSSTNTYFPAACCCWRFSTLGTRQGDWYLPAAGELYKGWQNMGAIYPSLQALGMSSAYNNIYYWSSTSYSSTVTWYVLWGNEGFSGDARYRGQNVRAFIQF